MDNARLEFAKVVLADLLSKEKANLLSSPEVIERIAAQCWQIADIVVNADPELNIANPVDDAQESRDKNKVWGGDIRPETT
jgi:hypothetical protein